MDVIEAIKDRRSVRNFTDEDIDESTVRELIVLGNYAPSAGNLQDRDFIIVRDQEVKNKLAKAAHQPFVADAPVVIVVCTNAERIKHYGERGASLYSIQDAAAAVENIMLAAHSMGLGSCWVGAFSEGNVSKALSLPRHARPVAMIPVGHYEKKPGAPERLPVEGLMHFDRW